MGAGQRAQVGRARVAWAQLGHNSARVVWGCPAPRAHFTWSTNAHQQLSRSSFLAEEKSGGGCGRAPRGGADWLWRHCVKEKNHLLENLASGHTVGSVGHRPLQTRPHCDSSSALEVTELTLWTWLWCNSARNSPSLHICSVSWCWNACTCPFQSLRRSKVRSACGHSRPPQSAVHEN